MIKKSVLNMSVKMAVLEEAPHAHLSAEAKRYIQYLMCCKGTVSRDLNQGGGKNRGMVV